MCWYVLVTVMKLNKQEQIFNLVVQTGEREERWMQLRLNDGAIPATVASSSANCCLPNGKGKVSHLHLRSAASNAVDL